MIHKKSIFNTEVWGLPAIADQSSALRYPRPSETPYNDLSEQLRLSQEMKTTNSMSPLPNRSLAVTPWAHDCKTTSFVATVDQTQMQPVCFGRLDSI